MPLMVMQLERLSRAVSALSEDVKRHGHRVEEEPEEEYDPTELMKMVSQRDMMMNMMMIVYLVL